MVNSKKQNAVIEAVFYGNFFYGICTVLSALETDLLQRQNLNPALFYIVLFSATVLFYNYPYARLERTHLQNPRTAWHQRNLMAMRVCQILLTLLISIAAIVFFANHCDAVSIVSWRNALLALIFPVAGGFYYGLNLASMRYNLRNIGWLKPFVIGFVWAGATVILPPLYRDIINGTDFQFTLQSNILFLKTFMYLSVLAIMFDIKDYTADSRANLKTVVVSVGLRKTISYVLIPLPILGILAIGSYGFLKDFSPIRLLLLTIPILLLLPAAWSLRRRRSLLYYLVVIDGLILLKAAFGIFASLY